MITITKHILKPNMRMVQHCLLEDHTQNSSEYHSILWATDNYLNHQPSDEMTETAYQEITPRYTKTQKTRDKRRKSKGEVFTPTWLCNHMNNQLDSNYFNKSNLFNREDPDAHTWTETHEYEKLPYSERDKYIQSRQLEIACGEAPFLVSPYDTSTGETILLSHRSGLLDRKLQWINNTVRTHEEWEKLVLTAYQTTYGYEYQGDNLLIARLNLLNTYHDYYSAKWDKQPSVKEYETISEIISWNLWQMDGLPEPKPKKHETPSTPKRKPQHANHCLIRQWEHDDPQQDTILFSDCKDTK